MRCETGAPECPRCGYDGNEPRGEFSWGKGFPVVLRFQCECGKRYTAPKEEQPAPIIGGVAPYQRGKFCVCGGLAAVTRTVKHDDGTVTRYHKCQKCGKTSSSYGT